MKELEAHQYIERMRRKRDTGCASRERGNQNIHGPMPKSCQKLLFSSLACRRPTPRFSPSLASFVYAIMERYICVYPVLE